ncbi:hypothetical protein HPB50_009834 [Hyalomma asiaticum]|uniref:Uncharacterized protein n=1 Tax=Hyalomma asiaticum TaxID=266040 RepID=A0ACB7TE26_HYAAI|nr:hypothetical protein HPB50_009834 [Hyalomma asiaticum]
MPDKVYHRVSMKSFKFAVMIDAVSWLLMGTLMYSVFMAATYGNDGLRILDMEFMKSVRDKLNLIPVIANAGTTPAEECGKFKRIILTN